MAQDPIEVKPIAGALGAEIFGVDLSKPLDNSTFARVHQALLDHQVIFFHDQDLSPEQHKAFGRRFGTLSNHTFVHATRDHAIDTECLEIRHEPGERYVFGEGWHMDHTWKEKPLMGGILHALDVPPQGGDTLFANLYLAYETLSDGMKRMLGRMRAVHAANPALYVGDKNLKMSAEEIDALRATHPVIRTHPETRRKLLFLHRAVVRHFDGWTIEESQPLLQFLYAHSERPEFTCRFRWRKGDVAFWDNRAVMHNPIADYQNQLRVMRRVAVDGAERPA
ncbi:MAG: TauD/TfdA family dioxygenase [Alphaproteobacteria bacterium]